MSYVAGYSVAHDVSARDWQLRKNGKQWLLGKTFDTFCPFGPAIVTRAAISGERDLFWCLFLHSFDKRGRDSLKKPKPLLYFRLVPESLCMRMRTVCICMCTVCTVDVYCMCSVCVMVCM